MGNSCGSRSKEYELLRSFSATKFKELFAKELNEPFDHLSEILIELESLRHALVDVPLTLVHDIGVNISDQPKFFEVLRAFIWSVSACHAGRVAKSGLNFSNTPPFFTVHSDDLSKEVLPMCNSLKIYFEVLGSAFVRMSLLEDEFKKFMKKAKSQNKEIKGNKADFGLSDSEKKQYYLNYAFNMVVAKGELQHLCRLQSKALEDEHVFKTSILPRINVESLIANLYGAQAYAEDLKTPKEIYLRFQSGNIKLKKLNKPESNQRNFASAREVNA